MTRVFTIFDLLWLLLSLLSKCTLAMARSHYKVMATLVTLSVLVTFLAALLSYRCIQISRLRNAYIVDDLSYQSQGLYNHLSNTETQQVLLRSMPPLTVHYMWCLKSHFEYKHYLSLISVVKVLKPDQIVFHYLEMPLIDAEGYFTWFEDAQREVAMLSLKQIQDPKHCSHDFSRGVAQSEDFPNVSGIFMMEEVAIMNLTRELYYKHTEAFQQAKMGCDDQDSSACVIPINKPSQLFLIPSFEPYSLVPGQGRVVFECPTIDAVNKASNLSAAVCLHLSRRLFPSDILRQNKTFERFARKIAFDNPEPVFAAANISQSAPPIAHILKFDGNQKLLPLCFASIVSAFTKGELRHVFLHGHLDRSSPDPLWEKLTKQFPVTHIPTPSIASTTDTKQQLLYGMNVLLQFGGVLFSCDTLVQKPLEHILQYPSVSTVQTSIYRIVHHHVDFSVLLAHQASSYLQTLIPVLKQLLESGSDRDFGSVAYHVCEQYPASVLMESSLVGHLDCQSDKCLPAQGQADVGHSYSVQLSWVKGTPPSSFKELAVISTSVSSLLKELVHFAD